MTISILGCGWFGKALAVHLVSKGYIVKGSTTTPDKLESLQAIGILPYLVDLRNNPFQQDFFVCDVLIVTCGAAIGELAKYAGKRVIYISSTGVYGNGEVNELSVPDASKPHYMAEQSLARPGLTVIRFAGLVGPGRLPGRFLAGKKDLPNGGAPVNLIHLEDCIGLTEAVIERPDVHLINGVTPDHPNRKTFYQQACEREGLVSPHFNEIEGEWKLVRSLYPDFYQYQVNDWLAWLAGG